MKHMRLLLYLGVLLIISVPLQADVTCDLNCDEGAGDWAYDSTAYQNNGELRRLTSWVAGDNTGDPTDWALHFGGGTDGLADKVKIWNTADWDGEFWTVQPDTQFVVIWELKIKTDAGYTPTGTKGDGIIAFTDIQPGDVHERGAHALVMKPNGTLTTAVHGCAAGDDIDTTTNINDNQWHTIKVVWNMDTTLTGTGGAIANDEVRVYVDGVLELTNDGSTKTDPLDADMTYNDTKDASDNIDDWIAPGVILGYYYNGGVEYNSFKGSIDDVRVSYGLIETPWLTSKTVKGDGSITVTYQVDGHNIDSWQWYKDSSPLSGQTEPNLVIANITESDEGFYYCEVNGGGASEISNTAQLLTERLVAYWDFEDRLVDTIDGWPGEYIDGGGSPFEPNYVTDSNSLTGKSLQLSDDSRHVEVLNSSEWFSFYTRGFTVSSWIKPAVVAGNGNMVSMNDNTNQEGWIHRLRNEYIENRIYDGTSYESARTDTIIATGEWYHIVTTYEPGARMAIYVNGALAAEKIADVPAFIPMTVKPLTLGGDTGGSNAFAGLLDDVKIWSYPLSKEEVAQEYGGVTGESICVNPPKLDRSGPNGEPDCKVNLYDFVEFAAQWLTFVTPGS